MIVWLVAVLALLALKSGAEDAAMTSQAFAREHRCALWSDQPWIMSRG
jgi:hypothetical protein